VVEAQEKNKVRIDHHAPEESIIFSKHALGNGILDQIRDIVYVKPESFNPADTKKIAAMIDKLNSQFVESGMNYILVGPGRWGSADPWLGIPVKWAQISAARLIVEAGLEHFRIDPSQGTHFFQNLTSFHVGYFTMNPFIQDGYYDVEYLNSFDAVYEDAHIRHIRFDKPLIVKIDGSGKKGCHPEAQK
jgi:hypothetical protein